MPTVQPTAQNGESCDCQTPGDWHRVANDFQQIMFEERARTERFHEALQCIADTNSNAVTMTEWIAWAKGVARNALMESHRGAKIL